MPSSSLHTSHIIIELSFRRRTNENRIAATCWSHSQYYFCWYFWHSIWPDRPKKCQKIGHNFGRKFCGNTWACVDSSKIMFCGSTTMLVRHSVWRRTVNNNHLFCGLWIGFDFCFLPCIRIIRSDGTCGCDNWRQSRHRCWCRGETLAL